ncbi:DUF4272 domain-containing protein [Bacillus aquiflavi]|uniref:DUF4272 domain-containing protein n=1 Tax=Bacillus aquiflavi TaxID=2672567 RepID=A0A6B3VRX3_9BACI|nr:DUF4272 domain-containing protein [Bacillus aquiflavi]MBA4536391.1 DUF4272 domain-containing protein [Bacillus aquiflavi]NEY80759.1 DUF4272 domain-containing protein [Bacillus aquiflavi]UAC48084.1 DUF4272 domain-containing protein [Bacillus aquiflavi]
MSTKLTIYGSIQEEEIVPSIIKEEFNEKKYNVTENASYFYIKWRKYFKSCELKVSIKPLTEKAMNDLQQDFACRPMDNKELQLQILTQISYLNVAIHIEMKEDLNKELTQHFLRILHRIKGIAYLANGDLLDCNGDVIVYRNGTSGNAHFVVHAAKKFVRSESPHSNEGQQRKERSLSILTENHIPYIEHLPQLPPEAEITFRTKEEIAQRAVALLMIIQFACDVANHNNIEESREFMKQLLRKYNVEHAVTQREWDFLHSHNEGIETEAIQLIWQYEAYWVLIWALGFVEELSFPSDICNCDFAIKTVSNCTSFEEFYEKAVLRESAEILNEADLIYRYHWACVNARVNNSSEPGNLNESVVVERHRALNWLISYQQADWDHVRTDT